MLLPALTGVRFVLAIWVMLHHLTGSGMMLEAWARGLPPWMQAVVRGGYLAVGSFFVLSGFVLSRSYAVPGFSGKWLRRYAANRLARIYPVYLLSLLIVAPFMLLENAPGKPSLIANYALLLQGWTGRLPVHWNTPAWSLSCEVFFYMCFPAAAMLLGAPRWRTVIAVIGFACFMPGTLRALGVPEMWKPLLHLADFLTGIAAAQAYQLLLQSGKPVQGRGYWLYLPGALLSLAIIAHPEVLGSWITLNGALRPLNAMLLIGFALGGGMAARGLSSWIAVYLGKASYAMYILHIPLLWWFKRLPLMASLSATQAGVVYGAGVIGVSTAVFRWVEEPANRRLRDWLGSGERV